MPKLDTIFLRTPDPERLSAFYRDILGMHEREDGTIGYAENEAGLRFENGDGHYAMSRDDLYWKISISVPDIDLACRQLSGLGVDVDGPEQFGDVAYVAHIKDPAGFVIELLDHRFKGMRPLLELDETRLGGGPCLNLLTLRSNDIRQVHRDCLAAGMTPVSIVPVPDHGFTLYFYAYTNERLLGDDLYAIENRTWVYQRPYTVLEVLFREQATAMRRPAGHEAGYAGASIAGLPTPVDIDHLLVRAARSA